MYAAFRRFQSLEFFLDFSLQGTFDLMTTSNVTLPIFGYPGPVFHIIHILALVSCLSSVLSSLSIILYLFVNEKRGKRRSFKNWTRGERLVVYLAAFDFFFSLSHTVDHIYIYSTISIPPDSLCQAFGFVVSLFMFGQWLMVFSIANVTSYQVLSSKNMSYGSYDWKLLILTIGIPLVICIVGMFLNLFGPNGAW